jgi:sulfate transport system permease protein
MQQPYSLRKPSVIPGFGLSLGVTVFYLSLIVLIPLSGLFFKTATLTMPEFWHVITDKRVVASYKLTFGTAFVAAAVNGVVGLVLAWVLMRYEFPGKKLIDAMIDLPFALPTAIAGIALTTIYASGGWLGKYLEIFHIKIAFTPVGIVMALVFIGMPFVVRTIEPVLQDLDKEVEEAAASLGASRLQTFRYIIFPNIFPAFVTGFSLAFARGLGEYGSVIFIAGNMPMVSEVVPLLIVIKLEQYDYAGATAIALVMLAASFVLLFVINALQKWSGARYTK